MKILSFGASNHSQSTNAVLARFAAQRFKDLFRPEIDIDTLDINAYEMPIYSLDREKQTGIPAEAIEIFERMGRADGLIISFAEYNGSYTSAWKNIFDWVSRIDQKVFSDKPSIVLAATPGRRAGASVLAAVASAAPFFGMSLCGQVGVGTWAEAYNTDNQALTRKSDIEKLDKALQALASSLG